MAAALVAGAASGAVAVERLVPDAHPTIQAALDAASSGDVIVVAAGDYSGPGNQDLDFRGLAITLQGVSKTTVRLRPEYNHRAFIFDDGEGPLTRIRDLTVFEGTTESEGGSAALITGASPTFLDCIFSYNDATGDGGAVRLNAGSPTFARCEFRNNTAYRGGAFHCDRGQISFIDCFFANNTAFGSGGAVHALALGATDLSFSRCRFINNQSDATGGAIDLHGDDVTLFVGACRFLQNFAEIHGGVAYLDGAIDATVVNSLLLYNTAGSDGRAWFERSAQATAIVNCTFTGVVPEASEKNAVMVLRSSVAEVANSIFWSNGGATIDDALAKTSSIHHCCIQGGYHGPGNIDADPMFEPSTPSEYRLAAGSPCIDAGSDEALPPGVALDLEGKDRITDGNGDGGERVDIGAYETPAPPTCIGDLDDDGAVGFGDLVALLASWGCTKDCPADLDGDGGVGFGDVVALLALWGPCP